jgi:hypothetical protein
MDSRKNQYGGRRHVFQREEDVFSSLRIGIFQQ